MNAMRQEDKGQGSNQAERLMVIQCHRQMQQLLRPLTVRIPYIDNISLPTSKTATRRTFGHLRSMIKAVALLRQYQKEVKTEKSRGIDVEYIEADAVDYKIVYRLMKPILPRTYTSFNEKALGLLEVLKKETKVVTKKGSVYVPFTNNDCQRWTGESEPTIRRRFNVLSDAGIIRRTSNEKPYNWRIVRLNVLKSIDEGLPKPDDICS